MTKRKLIDVDEIQEKNTRKQKLQTVKNSFTRTSGRVQVNFNLDDILDEKFREVVFKRKGMRRGAITEAYEEAIKMWIKENYNDDK